MSDSESCGIPCLWMRGGTSKGAYFLARDLPQNAPARDDLLLRVMGSPDARQTDGIGGGDPLFSKVAILSPSTRPDADVDYLFLQVFTDQALVSGVQPCGNILAGVGPAAIELGLVRVESGQTDVRIHMLNTAEIARASIQTPDCRVNYAGQDRIDGVPGTHAGVKLFFDNTEGVNCGALLPTGNVMDDIDGIACTLIDHGMPAVLMRASDLGLTGYESCAELEARTDVKVRIEGIRRKAGPMMKLGDVTASSTPKMILLAPARAGGVISTRSLIPHCVHASIGVLAAVSVASACLQRNGLAHDMATLPEGNVFAIEHPAGAMEIFVEHDGPAITAVGTMRTARKLFEGRVFPAPSSQAGQGY
jgi:4-oxalomesaconate tautomerase